LKIGNYTFTEPVPVADGIDCECEGVYAILGPAAGKPGYFDVIYFGQTKNAGQRITSSHERWGCWHRRAARPSVAFHHMRNSTQAQREARESELIAQYDPPCNRKG